MTIEDGPGQDFLSGTVAGRFEIQDRVGTGGMGEVYRARDTRLKCAVALKRLSPALRNDARYRRRLMEEAQRSAQMRNEPRVAAVYDFLETNDEFFLIMEFVEGETLRQRLTRPVQLQEFLKIAGQCAEALVAASDRGILHGDIKPENIMLTPAGQVKILDFGVAKQIVNAEDDETIDRVGALSGTPAYMAPEVLLQKPVDGRADILSLGIVFYEALTGHHPFRGDSFSVTSDRIRGEKPEPARSFNADVSPSLESILQRMLAKKAADRYADARELLADLDHLQSGITPARLLRLLPTQQRKTAKMRKGLLAGALVAALLAAIAFTPQARRLWSGKSVAPSIRVVILPLRSSSTDLNDRAFCDGLTEALALWLGQFGDKAHVEVVPPSEVRAEQVQNAEQARTKFNANRVVEGTVSAGGSQARVIYSVLDATTGHTLGGETITGSNSDRLAIEDQLVTSVAKVLGMEPRQDDRMEQGTHEPAAYDFYLRGRGYLQDFDKPENVDSAIAVFTHALERDPNYARAYAGLGESYWRKYEQTHARNWVELAGDNCKRAAELASDLAIAHNCLGIVSDGTGAYEQAVEEFQRAAALDPSSDNALLGLASAYDKLGRTADAESYFKRAISLHPQYWEGYARLGTFYFSAARYREAEEQFRRLTELVPEGEIGYSNLGAAYLAEGRYGEAVTQFERALQLQPSAMGYSNLASALLFEHRFDEAAHSYETAVSRKDAEYWQWGNLAEAYALLPAYAARVQPSYLKAATMVGEALRVNAKDQDAIHYAALYQAMLGHKDAALALLQRVPDGSRVDPELRSTDAKTLYRLGKNQEALAQLEKAVSGGYSRAWVRDDPSFAGLSASAEYQRIVR